MLIAEVKAQDFTYTSTNGIIVITRYTGTGGEVTVPSTISGSPVVAIGANAFLMNGLTGITLPNTVTNIGFQAFAECTNLTTAALPDTVRSIEEGAFEGCSSLTNVTIPEGLKSIEANAFSLCGSLTYLTLPDTVVIIGNNAFEGCHSLTGVSLPQGVRFIGEEAFGGCDHLTSITIPNTVTNLGGYSFSGCTDLTSVTIPNSVISIAGYAFSGCTSLTGIYFQGNAPSFGAFVFGGPPNPLDKATAYYLPGTTGWGSTIDGIPTALWILPYPLILNGSFGVRANQFGFTVWATNLSVVVEATTDLGSSVWSPVSTNALSGGSFSFSDPQWTNYSRRFYRIRSP